MTGSLPLHLSEAAFQSTVIDYALHCGWRCCHYSAAVRQSGGWSTPVLGNPGAPDLILARGGVVILAELKRTGGRLSPAQRDWLEQLGGNGRLWSPADWSAIVAELSPDRSRRSA